MSFWLIVVWTVLSTFLGYLRIKFTYWELNGVKQLKPHFMFGNFFKLKSLNHEGLMQEIYDSFKGKAKVAGMYIYTKPVAVILDLEVVKAILKKDCNSFENQGAYGIEQLSAMFTADKMELMVPQMIKTCEELKEACERSISESEEINASVLIESFITDVMGNFMLGTERYRLKETSEEFKRICSKIFERRTFNIRWHLFQQTYGTIGKILGYKSCPKYIEDYILRLTNESITESEEVSSESKGVFNISKDLINAKHEKSDSPLSLEQIAVQLVAFCEAGLKSSSSNLNCALYELSKHPKIQEKVRKEISTVLKKYNNEITYKSLMEMPYLEQIITETFRLYPSYSYLQRVTLNDYKIQGSDITLDKATTAFIPVQAILLDPEFYSKPREFNPERFNPSQRANRQPQSLLGFEHDPFDRITMQFALLLVRIGLVSLLKDFKFSPCSLTCESIKFSHHSLINVPLHDIYLKVENV